MNRKAELTDVWLKASILGANWAASEIILGSFLHNLHIPFKGNILTAIGLFLMITISYKWKDKGLFWRSGLICALLKTLSPSAVIFGPMVAIFIEALLLDISVSILGRNLAGFMLGSSLAMSWILFQKIINYILFYGMNIVNIYSDLLQFAQHQLNIHTNIFWLPVFVLLGVYIAFGLFTAITGVRMAKTLSEFQKAKHPGNIFKAAKPLIKRDEVFSYSIPWLVINFTGFIIALLLIGNSRIYLWMPFAMLLISVWVLRYKRALRQLLRPRFWSFFIVITVVSAIMISSINGSQDSWLEGLIIGIQMNFRAAVVILGFSVLGTELYNPVIKNYLAETTFRKLPAALELAFESLPYIIANLPDAATFVKKPGSAIRILLQYSETRFDELKRKQQARVYIISGDLSAGKTSFIIALNKNLLEAGISTTGIYSPRILQNNLTIGYNLVSIESNEINEFLTCKGNETEEIIGKFRINQETFQFGKQILSQAKILKNKLVFIDEIGKLELKNMGWKESLEQLLPVSGLVIIIAVRQEFVQQVLDKFCILNVKIFPVSTILPAEAGVIIRKELENPGI